MRTRRLVRARAFMHATHRSKAPPLQRVNPRWTYVQGSGQRAVERQQLARRTRPRRSAAGACSAAASASSSTTASPDLVPGSRRAGRLARSRPRRARRGRWSRRRAAGVPPRPPPARRAGGSRTRSAARPARRRCSSSAIASGWSAGTLVNSTLRPRGRARSPGGAGPPRRDRCRRSAAVPSAPRSSTSGQRGDHPVMALVALETSDRGEASAGRCAGAGRCGREGEVRPVWDQGELLGRQAQLVRRTPRPRSAPRRPAVAARRSSGLSSRRWSAARGGCAAPEECPPPWKVTT